MSGTDFYYEPQVRLAEELAVDRADRRRRADVLRATPAPRRPKRRSSWRAITPSGRASSRSSARSTAGRSGSLSLTASKAIQRRGFGPFMPGVYHAPYPDTYRFDGSADAVRRRSRCRSSRTRSSCTSSSPDEVAAIVVEPIQGEGGYIVPPPAFLQGLRELTTKHGILLVADEVQSGMGRTGKMFASEHFGLQGRHRRHREGDRLGPAARRHLRARRRHDVAARRAREHVRRQPGGLRRGATRRSGC